MPNMPGSHRPAHRTSTRLPREKNNFYCDRRWRRFRAWFLAQHPLCADPNNQHPGQDRPAKDVHHLKERRDFPELTFVEENCQGLCRPCHAYITRCNQLRNQQ